MKKLPIKIFFNLFLMVLVSACHKLDHSINIFEPLNKMVLEKKVKESNIKQKKTFITNEKKEKPDVVVKKISKTLKNIYKPRPNKKFNIDSILGLSEIKLFEKMGLSDFVKIEGQLKNHQYHFSQCFLDVFVIKKENSYLVNFIETRPTKLKGNLNKEKCLEEIEKKIKFPKK